MLFNSALFITIFLPATLAGFFLLGVMGRQRLALGWLLGASLLFYGHWNPLFIPLLLGSLGVNYGLGLALARRPRRWLLGLGIAANLATLAWFKYSGFLASAVNDLLALGVPVPQVVLPLAISFYTFQQVAFLVDAHDGQTREQDFLKYGVFICFFPQLIAGPIVHHKEVLGQFEQPETYRPHLGNLAVGATVFIIGLFKKVFLADLLVPTTALAYGPAAEGVAPGLVHSWQGVTAFALQLYFDFSGYSDMAIGLALMIGIRLPLNFASPFKAASIIEFWQRWHMTLTRFLTAYLYNPLVMTLTARRLRAGRPVLKRSSPQIGPFLVLLAAPTLITMGLAGVWHGAGWQFVIFGLIHGGLLVANHAWRAFGPSRDPLGPLGRPVGVLATFVVVSISFVFFKATSLDQALMVLQGLVGLETPGAAAAAVMVLPPDGAGGGAPSLLSRALTLLATEDTLRILLGLGIVWFLPNTQEWLSGYTIHAGKAPATAPGPLTPLNGLRWAPTPAQGVGVGALACLTLIQAFSMTPTEFLYFTF